MPDTTRIRCKVAKNKKKIIQMMRDVIHATFDLFSSPRALLFTPKEDATLSVSCRTREAPSPTILEQLNLSDHLEYTL